MNTWSSNGYLQHAGYVPALGAAVLDLLGPQPGERILDLGCGEGSLTEQIASAGAAVVGVDTSPEMIAAARARGIDARLISAEQLPFDREFDAVFSNAALHWVRDHDALLDSVRRSLKPGGRLVAEFGGYGNVAAIQTGVRALLAKRGIIYESSRYYPTDTEYAARLARHGFTVQQIDLIPRPTPLPTGMRGWLETFERMTVERLAEADRAAFIQEVEELLRPELCDWKGQWTAHYVRLRFSATRL
jgi:trans-aconitate methyltransferase